MRRKLLYSLIIAAAILLGALLWLLSPAGLRTVTQHLEGRLARTLNAPVEIDGLRLHWPLSLRLERLRVADEETIYLDVRDVALRLSAQALVQRSVRVRRLHVRSFEYNGLPERDPSPPERADPAKTVPSTLPDLHGVVERISVDDLSVHELVVGPPLLDRRMNFELDGSFVPVSDGRSIELTLRQRSDVPGLREARLEGFVRSRRPHQADLDLKVEASGALQEEWALNSVVHVRLDTAQSAFLMLEQFFVEYGPATVALMKPFRLTWEAGRYDAETVDLAIGQGRLSASGHWHPDEIALQLSATAYLQELAVWLLLDEHRPAGEVSLDIQLSGTPTDPEIDGHFRVTDGSYENDLSGTILRDLQVNLSGQRDHLRIERFSATDGRDGTVQLTGLLHMDPQAGYPFEGKLTLKQFHLMRNDLADAVGAGELRWTGTRQASRLEGEVKVTPVTVHVPDRLPPGLIDLDVVEIDGEEEEPDENEGIAVDASPRHQLSLDFAVVVPDRFFVRGNGLDTEWAGRIEFSGSLPEPVIVGSLEIIRGRFLFFGRRLSITRGVISLDGTYPPAPDIDIVTQVQSGGITAILRISGDVERPAIELDSVPQMPEDEILARLLFGREASRITPWQAVTLARAINQIRGGGSTFDVMGRTRRFLHVDQIELREADQDEGQMAVSVGKYVSDRVYVELERGVGAEGGRALVEVELTPTIRLETEAGTQAGSALGVVWGWDY